MTDDDVSANEADYDEFIAGQELGEALARSLSTAELERLLPLLSGSWMTWGLRYGVMSFHRASEGDRKA